MTWEEAEKYFEMKVFAMEKLGDTLGPAYDAFKIALTALRGPTREMVEKVWRGKWELIGADKRGRGGLFSCTRCRGLYPVKNQFCPHCGAPMMAEAVDMTLERMEALCEKT